MPTCHEYKYVRYISNFRILKPININQFSYLRLQWLHYPRLTYAYFNITKQIKKKKKLSIIIYKSKKVKFQFQSMFYKLQLGNK